MSGYAAGLTPDEFWRCTMVDLMAVCDGHRRRLESHRALVAWHLAPILNMFSKDRITPASLLGTGKRITPDRASLTRAWLESEATE